MSLIPRQRASFRAAALLGACLGAAGACLPAQATRELSWVFEDTGISASSNSAALAIRQGDTWPIIVDGGGNMYGRRTPLIDPLDTPNPWFAMRSGLFPAPDGPVISRNHPDAEPIFFQPGGERVVSYTDPQGRLGNAGAFTTDGDLALGLGNATYAQGVYNNGAASVILDMDVAPDGTVGVLTNVGNYYEYRFGEWGGPVNQLSLFNEADPVASNLRLRFDGQSRPHVIGRGLAGSGSVVVVNSFDTQRGEWVQDSFGNTFGAPATAYTDVGGGLLGVAWADDVDLTLNFAYLEPGGEWVEKLVIDGINSPVQNVGLDFDDEGLAVISYVDNGNYWLAIDPIIVGAAAVPEPATAGLIIGGLALAMRRRR